MSLTSNENVKINKKIFNTFVSITFYLQQYRATPFSFVCVRHDHGLNPSPIEPTEVWVILGSYKTARLEML